MKIDLNTKNKKILLIILIISIFFVGGIITQNQISLSYFYVEKNYMGEAENLEEIIEIVERFDYETHLNISKDPYGVRILNYSDPEIIDELSLKIEEDRKSHFLQVPFINSHLIYSFNMNRSSFFNITLEELDEYGVPFWNCEGIQMKSESFNICLDYEIIPPNIFLNSSFYPDPIDKNVEYHIEEVITVVISFDYSSPEFLNSNSNSFDQIVVLNESLEIIFICVYNFHRTTT